MARRRTLRGSPNQAKAAPARQASAPRLRPLRNAPGRWWLLCTTALLPVQTGTVAAQTMPAPSAGPTGGQVMAGQAAISQAPGRTTITQGSDRAAIDWQQFNVGRDHTVQFQQPNAGSWTLNRVMTPDPSVIAGRIQANGGVAIVNQSGVVFAQGAQVDVGSLIASTANITNENFMSGRMVFDGAPRPGARVENHGEITVADRGLAALVAPGVANSGTIRARLGRVAMAGAETYALDLAGDGLLSIEVTQAVRQTPGGGEALVTNSGLVEAAGGSVVLSAHAASGLVEDLVRNTGRVSAPTEGGRTGQVALRAEGGSLRVQGTVQVTGGAGQAGGQIALQATESVTVAAGAQVDASGGVRGGTALVGTTGIGRSQRMVRRTTVERGAEIRADATESGRGGTIAVNSTERTVMQGTLSARGGPQGGDGGLIEVSGQSGLSIDGVVDVQAPAGSHGEFLLDPVSILVSTSAPSGDSQTGAPTPPEAPGPYVVATDGASGNPQTIVISPDTIQNFAGRVTLSATDEARFSASVAKANGDLHVNASTITVDNNIIIGVSGGTGRVLSLRADTIDLGNAVVLSSTGAEGVVELGPLSGTRNVLIGTGGGSGTLLLSAARLNAVQASVLRIGETAQPDAAVLSQRGATLTIGAALAPSAPNMAIELLSSGDISVNQSVTATGSLAIGTDGSIALGGNLRGTAVMLAAGTGITQGGGNIQHRSGAGTALPLSLSTGAGSIALGSGTNGRFDIAGATAPGSIGITSGQAVATSGAIEGAGVTLSARGTGAAGTIAIGGSLTSTDGVTLAANGAITQTAAIDAGADATDTLRIRNGLNEDDGRAGSATLLDAGNRIRRLDARTTGALSVATGSGTLGVQQAVGGAVTLQGPALEVLAGGSGISGSGNVGLIATSGAISVNEDVSAGNAAVLSLRASGLSIDSAATIGADGGTVEIGSNAPAPLSFGTATGAAGEVVFANPGAIAGRVTSGTSELRLGATTIGGTTVRASSVVVNEALTYSTGTLEITSTGTLALGTDAAAPAFAVTAAQMRLTAGGAISQANGTLAISGSDPAANLFVATVDGAAGSAGTVTLTGANDIPFLLASAPGAVSVTSISASLNVLRANGASVTLTAPSILLPASLGGLSGEGVTAATGAARLTSIGAGGIAVGAALNGTDIALTAGGTGGIALDAGTVTATAADGSIRLDSAAGIAQGANAGLVADSLSARAAAGDIDLQGSGNDIRRLGTGATAPDGLGGAFPGTARGLYASGTIGLRTQGALEVAAGGGVDVRGGSATLRAGSLIISAPVAVTGGANTLTLIADGPGATGTISQAPTAALSATRLTGSATGAVDLRGANGIAGLGAFSAGGSLQIATGGALAVSGTVAAEGDISLRSGGALSIAGDVTATDGAEIALRGSSITQSALVRAGNAASPTGGTLVLTADADGVQQLAGGRIVADALDVTASGAVSLTAGIAPDSGGASTDWNAVGTLTGSAGITGLTVLNQGDLTLQGTFGTVGSLGQIRVETTGDLTLAAGASLPAGIVRLVTGGDIALAGQIGLLGFGTGISLAATGSVIQQATGSVTSSDLYGIAGGSFDLTAGANSIGLLGGQAGGSFRVRSSRGFETASSSGLPIPLNLSTGVVSGITSNDVFLQAPNITLSQSLQRLDATAPGTVRLVADRLAFNGAQILVGAQGTVGFAPDSATTEVVIGDTGPYVTPVASSFWVTQDFLPAVPEASALEIGRADAISRTVLAGPVTLPSGVGTLRLRGGSVVVGADVTLADGLELEAGAGSITQSGSFRADYALLGLSGIEWDVGPGTITAQTLRASAPNGGIALSDMPNNLGAIGGTAAGAFEVQTAGGFQIGGGGTGGITAPTVRLTAQSGSITQTADAPVTASTLQAIAHGGDVILDAGGPDATDALNGVGTLYAYAGSLLSPGDITLRNASGFTVGAARTVDGQRAGTVDLYAGTGNVGVLAGSNLLRVANLRVEAAAGSVLLDSPGAVDVGQLARGRAADDFRVANAGNLTLVGPGDGMASVEATDVNLTALSGDITQTASGFVVADRLVARAPQGTVSLNAGGALAPTNQVRELAGGEGLFGFTLRNGIPAGGQPLSITGRVRTTGGGANIVVEAASGIDLNASGGLTATLLQTANFGQVVLRTQPDFFAEPRSAGTVSITQTAGVIESWGLAASAPQGDVVLNGANRVASLRPGSDHDGSFVPLPGYGYPSVVAGGDVTISSVGLAGFGAGLTVAGSVLAGPGGDIGLRADAISALPGARLSAPGGVVTFDSISGLSDLQLGDLPSVSRGDALYLAGSTLAAVEAQQLSLDAVGNIYIDGVVNLGGTPQQQLILDAGGLIAQTSGAAVTVARLELTAGSGISMGAAGNAIGELTGLSSPAGDASLRIAAGQTLTVTGEAAVAARQRLTVIADDLDINETGRLRAPDGTISLQTVTAGRTIGLGTAAGGMTLTAVELDRIGGSGAALTDTPAARLRIGGSTAGTITLGGDVSIGSGTEVRARVLELYAGNGAVNGAAATVTAPFLAATGTSVDLDGANAIGGALGASVAGQSLGDGTLAGGLGGISSVTSDAGDYTGFGFRATNGNAILRSTEDMAVNASVAASGTGALLDLRSDGDLEIGANRSVYAEGLDATMRLQAGGDLTVGAGAMVYSDGGNAALEAGGTLAAAAGSSLFATDAYNLGTVGDLSLRAADYALSANTLGLSGYAMRDLSVVQTAGDLTSFNASVLPGGLARNLLLASPAGGVTLTGTLTAAQDLIVTGHAGVTVQAGARAQTGRSVLLTATAGTVRNDGTVVAGAGGEARLEALAGDAINAGLLQGPAVRLVAAGGDAVNAGTLAGGTVFASSVSGDVTNAAGAQVSGTGFTASAAGEFLNQGSIAISGAMQAMAGTGWTNAPTGTVSGAAVTASTATGTLENRGAISATAGAVDLAGGTFLNGGAISATGEVLTRATAGGWTNAATGRIVGADIEGSTIGGALTNHGIISAASNVMLAGPEVDSSGTVSASAGDVALTATAGDIVQSGGLIQARGATPGGVVVLTAADEIRQDAGQIYARAIAGTSTAGSTSLQSPDNRIDGIAPSGFTAGGDFRLRVADAATIPLKVAGPVTVGAGRTLALLADDLALSAALRAPGGIILLLPATLNGTRGYVLGGAGTAEATAADRITLTSAEIAQISSGTAPAAELRLGIAEDGGRAATGVIEIRGEVAFANPVTGLNPRIGTLWLGAEGDIAQSLGTSLVVPTLRAEATGAIRLDPGTANNRIATLQDIRAGGDVILRSGAPLLSVTSAAPDAPGIQAGAGATVTLRADDLDIAAAVSAPEGLIQILPETVGRGVTLGAAGPGTVALDAAELARIGGDGSELASPAAQILRIGATAEGVRSAGDVTLAGPITLEAAPGQTRVGTLDLQANGNIRQTGGALDVEVLTGSAGGDIRLEGPNAIALATGIDAGGVLVLANAGALAADGVTAATSATLTSGAALTASGVAAPVVTLNGSPVLVSGAVAGDTRLVINSGSGITQAPGVLLSTAVLTVSAAGAVGLGEANQIGALAGLSAGGQVVALRSALPFTVLGSATAAGGLALSSDDDLRIAAGASVSASPGSAGPGDVRLTAGGVLLSEGTLTASGSASLAGGGGISVAGGLITAGLDVGASTPGAITLSDGKIDAVREVRVTSGLGMTVSRFDIDPSEVRLTAGGNMSITGSSITSTGLTTLAAGGTLLHQGSTFNVGSLDASAGQGAELTMDGGRFTVEEAAVFTGTGGIRMSSVAVVEPRDPTRFPAVVFNTSGAFTGAEVLELVAADIAGRPPSQQVTQVRNPLAEAPGVFGPASNAPAGSVRLNLDAGRSPVVLLIDGGSATGTIVSAGRLGIQGRGGETSLFARFVDPLGRVLEGAAAARLADVTRPFQAGEVTRYRINNCVVSSVNCVVPSQVLVIPQIVPTLNEVRLATGRPDPDTQIPNVADEVRIPDAAECREEDEACARPDAAAPG